MISPADNPFPFFDGEEDSPSCTKPSLPGSVIIAKSHESLIENMAQDLMAHSFNCYRSFGDFQLALPGNVDAIPLYRYLMIDPLLRTIPWRNTHLWQVNDFINKSGDLYQVSIWQNLKEIIGDHSGIPPSQQHPIPLHSHKADHDYQKSLCSVLEWREKGHDRLDYVLLTLGADGSIAGLNPDSSLINETHNLVKINHSPEKHIPDIVTMTLPLINSARFIAVMVMGEDKQNAIQRLTNSNESVSKIPARGLQPLGGELRWYLDYQACP